MKKRFVFLLLILLIMTGLTDVMLATTWARKKVVCPLCGTTNSFEAIRSSGSYVYEWPSKYQYVFWPLTDIHVLYSCKKCRLTCFMWDFRDTLQEKRSAIEKQLAGINLEKDYEHYSKIPMTKRLEIAEKVYTVLEKDDEFWCRFYRIMGYHYDEAGNKENARKAREKALEIARTMLNREGYADQLKELLLISGAMHHFLGKEELALSDMKKALELSYRNKGMTQKEVEGLDGYLSNLLKDCRKLVERSLKIKNLYESGIAARSVKEKARCAYELHKEGLKLYEEEGYKEAIDVWLKEIKIAPERPKPYRNIGLTYRILEDLDSAEKYHKKAISIHPNFGATYYSLGLVFFDREKYKKARGLFRKSIDLKYVNADVYYSLGQVYKQLKNYEQAILAYRKVIDLKNEYPGAHYQIGDSYRLMGQLDIAKEELEKERSNESIWRALCKIAFQEIDTATNPTDASAFFTLGMLCKKVSGKIYLEKAIEAFKKVIKLNPSYPEAHFRLGRLYEKKEDKRRAKKEYTKELKINPEHIDARQAIANIKGILPKDNFSSIEPAELTEETKIKRIMQLQEYWKKISFEALNIFRDADSKIVELIEFMDTNAYYSLPLGPVTTRVTLSKEQQDFMNYNPYSFEVVYMPEEYAKNLGGLILTESGGKTVRIASDFEVKEWLGIMLTHELFHVHCQLVRGENSNDPEQYLKGEVEAHLLEMKLLKFWSEEAYFILIKKGIPLYKRNDNNGLFNLFTSLYPVSSSQASPNESSLGMASCLVAIAFEEALQRGATKKELGVLYQRLKEY